MKKVLLVGLVLLVVSVSGVAHALTATVNGTSVTLDYTEPTANENGTTLKDLHHTTPKFNIGQGFVNAPDVPASALTGGGHVLQDVVVPVLAGQEIDVQFKATATDISGNESKDSPVITKRIDKLSPAGPE